MQGRQGRRTARNAARAVHIELEMNRLSIVAARDYGAFAPLTRAAFERLLPELANWLSAADLRTIAAAYMSHAGYEQARQGHGMPEEMRRHALGAIVAAHDTALALIGRLAFTRAEQRRSTAPELRVTDLGGKPG